MKSTYLFFILLFLSCSGGRTPAPDPEFTASDPELGPMSCQADTDCVLVKIDCCSCKSGGEFAAVHKSQKEAFNKDLEKRCSTEEFRTCLDENLCNDIQQARCENSTCMAIVTKKSTSN